MIIKKLINRLRYYIGRKSYSQCGEDLIVYHIFRELGIHKPTYLDVGSNHPTKFNNTYLFYREGSTGFCIEPDKKLALLHRIIRRRDRHFNCALGEKNEIKKLYVSNENTLNTTSEEVAYRYCSNSPYRIVRVEDIEICNIMDLLERNSDMLKVDFLSLDVEGLDEVIINTIDFDIFRPIVICVETLTFETKRHGVKQQSLINKILDSNYKLYADTYVNTIFVDIRAWNSIYE